MRCKRLPGRCFASPLPVCAKSSNRFNQLQYVGFECSRYSTCIHRMTRYHLLIPTTSQNLGQKAKSNLKATLYEPPITHPAKCVESDFDCFTIFTHKIIVSFPSRPFLKFVAKNAVQIIQKYATFALSTKSCSPFIEICTKSPSVDMIIAASREGVQMEKVVALLLRWSPHTSTMIYCYPSLGIY